MKHIHVFDEEGHHLTGVQAHAVEQRFYKQPLPEGYFAIQDRPGSKFYLMNYVTGIKYKAEN